MEKKETKEVLHFFSLLWKAYERKEFVLVYCKLKPNTFIQESITLYCFSFFGEGSVTL